jgi:hypothetical protein
MVGILVSMLQATRGGFRLTYTITNDGVFVTRWSAKLFGRGTFVLADGGYTTKARILGSEFMLIDPYGRQLAVASNPYRRQWTVTAGTQGYVFHRPSWWRQHLDLVVGGQPVGFIQRPSLYGTAVAELPMMPLAVQVFALVLALYSWDVQPATAWPAA